MGSRARKVSSHCARAGETPRVMARRGDFVKVLSPAEGITMGGIREAALMADPVQAPIDELRKAVALAQSGDWQAAHLIAQDYDGDPIANWIHGIVHRMEGDVSNASYWYERCG